MPRREFAPGPLTAGGGSFRVVPGDRGIPTGPTTLEAFPHSRYSQYSVVRTVGAVPFHVAKTEDRVVPAALKSTRNHPSASQEATWNPSSGVAEIRWAWVADSRSTTRPPVTG